MKENLNSVKYLSIGKGLINIIIKYIADKSETEIINKKSKSF